MDAASVFAIISKGLALLPILIQAGQEVGNVIQNLKALSDSAQAGTVTAEQLATLESELDASIADFNEPMK